MAESKIISLEEWKTIIDNIANSNIVKRINIAGGEPFLCKKLTISLVNYIKNKGLETSVISNGVYLTEDVLHQIEKSIDMIGISCDSGSDEINIQIGRQCREDFLNQATSHPHTYHVRRVAKLCKEHHIYFKLNSVICRENLHDDSIFDLIQELKPQRWKVFRVLEIDNENGIEKDERPPYTGFLSDEEWNDWKKGCQARFENIHNIRIMFEDNNVMKNSYIQVDEEGYLLNSTSGEKLRCANLLKEHFEESYKSSFDEQKFYQRGGFYNFDIEDLHINDMTSFNQSN